MTNTLDDIMTLAEGLTPSVSDDVAKRLNAKLRWARDEDIAIAELEERLKVRKKALLDTRQRDLVDMLDEANTDRWAIPAEGNHSPYDVKIKDYYNAKIPEESADEAYAWAEENGHGGIVKHSFTINFGMHEEESVEKFREALSALGVDFGEVKGIHASTLKAWVKREMTDGNGADIPRELFGIECGRVAEIKERKERVKKTRN